MTMPRRAVFAVLLVFALQRCAASRPPATTPGQPDIIRGQASWYGQEFAGRATANGEIFDPMQLTAAHRTLPFGTVVEVRNTANGNSVRVRINDRGPFIGDRVIDLSYAAANAIGLVGPGVGPVEITIVGMQTSPAPGTPSFDAPPPEISIPIPSEREPAISGVAAPQPSGRSGFYVQLGSFAVEENARALLRRISGVAPAAHIARSGTMHRVRVGPFVTRRDALATRDTLEGAGFSGVVMMAD